MKDISANNKTSNECRDSDVNILIVDDEYFNFEILEGALGQRFQLKYIESGQACLSFAIANIPDLILLDVCMPGLDGYDTCRLLKNTPETKHIPVFMISGLESEHEKQAGFDAGCDEYIVKPFSVASLSEKITKTITSKNM